MTEQQALSKALGQVAHIRNVLSIKDPFDDEYAGLWSLIWWRTDGEYAPVTFWVICSDLFVWGCTDDEQITPENFPMLLPTVKDVATALGASDPCGSTGLDEETWKAQWKQWRMVGAYAADLWCARVRGMRPQKPYYEKLPESIVPLFDACGPERNEGSE